jgi:hypothetical protein
MGDQRLRLDPAVAAAWSHKRRVRLPIEQRLDRPAFGYIWMFRKHSLYSCWKDILA